MHLPRPGRRGSGLPSPVLKLAWQRRHTYIFELDIIGLTPGSPAGRAATYSACVWRSFCAAWSRVAGGSAARWPCRTGRRSAGGHGRYLKRRRALHARCSAPQRGAIVPVFKRRAVRATRRRCLASAADGCRGSATAVPRRQRPRRGRRRARGRASAWPTVDGAGAEPPSARRRRRSLRRRPRCAGSRRRGAPRRSAGLSAAVTASSAPMRVVQLGRRPARDDERADRAAARPAVVSTLRLKPPISVALRAPSSSAADRLGRQAVDLGLHERRRPRPPTRSWSAPRRATARLRGAASSALPAP